MKKCEAHPSMEPRHPLLKIYSYTASSDKVRSEADQIFNTFLWQSQLSRFYDLLLAFFISA